MISNASSEEDEVVNGDLVLEGEAVIGEDVDRFEDEATGEQLEVRGPRVPATPKLPSMKEIERHNLGHLVYRSWCPFCVAGKKPNTPHRRTHGDRAIPLLVADYCFIRSSQDASSTTVLVGKIVPQNVIFAFAVDVKGCNSLEHLQAGKGD